MYYGNIKKTDIANGTGVRVSLFVSGCRNHCNGCFQPETWNFEYGQPFTDDTMNELLAAVSEPHISGITILGGDPFEPENQPVVMGIIEKIKNRFPDKTVWCYTGYLFEELAGWTSTYSNVHLPVTKDILSRTDVLVDGRFMESKKNISLLFRGSENQRLIDVPATFHKNHVVLWNGNQKGEK